LKTCRENDASTPLLCSVSACSACSGFDAGSDEVMASSMKPLEVRESITVLFPAHDEPNTPMNIS